MPTYNKKQLLLSQEHLVQRPKCDLSELEFILRLRGLQYIYALRF